MPQDLVKNKASSIIILKLFMAQNGAEKAKNRLESPAMGVGRQKKLLRLTLESAPPTMKPVRLSHVKSNL